MHFPINSWINDHHRTWRGCPANSHSIIIISFTRSWPYYPFAGCTGVAYTYIYIVVMYTTLDLTACKRFSSTTASHSSIASLLLDSAPRLTPAGGRRNSDTRVRRRRQRAHSDQSRTLTRVFAFEFHVRVCAIWSDYRKSEWCAYNMLWV